MGSTRGSHGRGQHTDKGQALPLVVVVMLVAVGVLVIMVRIGSLVIAHARARTAADAAALAGVQHGRAAAREMAEDNGGELVDFVTDGGSVEVRVRVGDAVALARAGWSTEPSGTPSATTA